MLELNIKFSPYKIIYRFFHVKKYLKSNSTPLMKVFSKKTFIEALKLYSNNLEKILEEKKKLYKNLNMMKYRYENNILYKIKEKAESYLDKFDNGPILNQIKKDMKEKYDLNVKIPGKFIHIENMKFKIHLLNDITNELSGLDTAGFRNYYLKREKDYKYFEFIIDSNYKFIEDKLYLYYLLNKTPEYYIMMDYDEYQTIFIGFINSKNKKELLEYIFDEDIEFLKVHKNMYIVFSKLEHVKGPICKVKVNIDLYEKLIEKINIYEIKDEKGNILDFTPSEKRIVIDMWKKEVVAFYRSKYLNRLNRIQKGKISFLTLVLKNIYKLDKNKVKYYKDGLPFLVYEKPIKVYKNIKNFDKISDEDLEEIRKIIFDNNEMLSKENGEIIMFNNENCNTVEFYVTYKMFENDYIKNKMKKDKIFKIPKEVQQIIKKY